MFLAHTKQAAGQISEQFQNRNVRKIYQVIVHGIVERVGISVRPGTAGRLG